MGWLDESSPTGQQFTSTVQTVAPAAPAPAPMPTPERIIRPFEAFKERRDQRLAQLRAPPDAEHQAELCWGKPPKLQDSPTDPGGLKDTGGTSVTTRQPEDEPPSPPSNPTLVWREHDRKVKKIRVENPDDPEQYVMVERIEEWFANAPSAAPFNGRLHKFVFKNG